jgi:hypothetical protein
MHLAVLLHALAQHLAAQGGVRVVHEGVQLRDAVDHLVL